MTLFWRFSVRVFVQLCFRKMSFSVNFFSGQMGYWSIQFSFKCRWTPLHLSFFAILRYLYTNFTPLLGNGGAAYHQSARVVLGTCADKIAKRETCFEWKRYYHNFITFNSLCLRANILRKNEKWCRVGKNSVLLSTLQSLNANSHSQGLNVQSSLKFWLDTTGYETVHTELQV